MHNPFKDGREADQMAEPAHPDTKALLIKLLEAVETTPHATSRSQFVQPQMTGLVEGKDFIFLFGVGVGVGFLFFALGKGWLF
jgi:hypothetical protein